MPTVQSPEQVRDSYRQAMPGPLGEAFTDLYNETSHLFSKWQTAEALFGKQETIDLLNVATGQFFREIQLMLRENIFMHICRLTDPPQIGRFHNLTLQSLPGLLPPNVDATFRNSLLAAIDDAVAKSEFARIWRNKMLAHTSLPIAAGGKPVVIPNVSHIDQAASLDAIGVVMNCVEKEFTGREIAWAMSFEESGSVSSLLYYLRKGLDAQRNEDAARRGSSSA